MPKTEAFIPVDDWWGLRSVGVYLLLGFWGAFALLAAVVLLLLGAPIWDRRRRSFHAVARMWARRLVRGRIHKHAPLEIRGTEHLGAGPYVVVANHQSTVDLLVLYEMPFAFRTVVKRSWAFTPLGFNLWLAGYPLVDAKAGAEGRRRLFAACRDVLKSGISVLIFPEGTRARDHELLPFRRGAFDLALDTHTALLPVAVAGTDDLSHPSTWRYSFAPGHRMIIEFLPPINVPEGDERSAIQLRSELKDLLVKRVDGLREEIAASRS